MFDFGKYLQDHPLHAARMVEIGDTLHHILFGPGDDAAGDAARFEELLDSFGLIDTLRSRPVGFGLLCLDGSRSIHWLAYPGAQLSWRPVVETEEAASAACDYQELLRAQEYHAQMAAEERASQAEAEAYNARDVNWYRDERGTPYPVLAGDDFKSVFLALAPRPPTTAPVALVTREDRILSVMRDASKLTCDCCLTPAVRDYAMLWFAYRLGFGAPGASLLRVSYALNCEVGLRQQLAKYIERMGWAGFSTDPSAPLFPAASGSYLKARTVRRIVQRAEELARVRPGAS